MTINKSKYVSISALFSLMLLSLVLLCPAKSMASSGGGCTSPVGLDYGGTHDEIEVYACFYSDLSGYVDVSWIGTFDTYVAAEAQICDVNSGYCESLYSPYVYDGEEDFNYQATNQTGGFQVVSGHVYEVTLSAYGKDTAGQGGWYTLPDVPNVTY